MEQVYIKSRKVDSGHRPGSSNLVWALVCGTFLLGGYFYGHREGSGKTVVTSSLRPTQADDTVPIGPGFGGNATPGDLLARAQLENELIYTDLQSFICKEHMDRYQGHVNDDKAHQIDTVNAQVSFENGVENYTDIHENNRSRPAMSSIPGAWSEGEFGTLLRQTRALLGSQPVALQGETQLDGVPAALYAFDVSGQDSPWDLAVGSQQYRVPFRTNVWVGKATGQIMKIERITTAIPPGSGISEIQWGVVLKPVDLDGKSWLLPSSGDYSVQYENSRRREFNAITFSDYHRYSSQSVIHF